MGGSYRSSSSSSSSSSGSYRSSYSSSSTSRSSHSSSSSSSSGSGYTSSSPEPTSYFKTKNYEINIHFNENGSAHIKEKFIVIAKSAKVGIVRAKFSPLFEWKIENLTVSPDGYVRGDLPHQIYLIWSEGTNEKDLPLEIEYDIKNGIDFLGNFPLVYWSITRTALEANDVKMEISWDPNIQWKNLEIKQKRYETTISDYVYEEIKSERINNSIRIDANSINKDFRDFIITGFLEEGNNFEMRAETPSENLKYYDIKQTSRINTNTSNEHSGTILIPDEGKEIERNPSLSFESNYFLSYSYDSIFSFLTPTYQFIYGLSDSLSSSFWTLYYANIIQIPKRQILEGKNYHTFDIAYSKLGEHKTSFDGKKEIIQILPFQIRYENHTLGSFSMELEFPEELDLKSTSVQMFISNCHYCSTFDPVLSLPIEIGKDKNKIFLNWENPLPTGYFPMIQIETDSRYFSPNYFYTYIAALRAFFIAPGAGSNTGYLLINSFLFLTPFLFSLILYKNKMRKKSEKEKQVKFLLSIQKDDPTFTLEDFNSKSKYIAERIVTAWSDGDMNPARHFISAGVFQRFQIQLKLLKEVDGIQNLMREFEVQSQEILAISNFNEYATVHVKFKCVAKDFSVPIHSTQQQIESIFKQTSLGSYEEVYSFARKITAKTEAGKDLIHNRCPSCGAESPYRHNTNKCQFCSSIFNSGESDWVLSEITQIVEWNPERFKSEENFAKEHHSLPTSIQIIEDRASALLWKWIYAKTKGNSDFIRRETLNKTILEQSKTKELFYLPVVGAAEIKKLEKQEKELLAEVTIHWSAARSVQALAENRVTNLRLRLKQGRAANLGFSEVSCKNCGAPYPEMDSNQCSYCNEPIPELVSDWLLESIR